MTSIIGHSPSPVLVACCVPPWENLPMGYLWRGDLDPPAQGPSAKGSQETGAGAGECGACFHSSTFRRRSSPLTRMASLGRSLPNLCLF